MGKILKSNFFILMLVGLCLILSAICQLFIPHIVSKGITEITDTAYVFELLQKLAIIFVARTILQGSADSLNAYAETTIRLSLIEYIYFHHQLMAHSAFMTRVTEDTTRVAAAISNALYLTGSCLLVISTTYLLLIETAYFLIPLVIIWSLTALHLKKSSAFIAKLYQAEIKKEEAYKSSFLELIKTASVAPYRHDYKEHHERLVRAADARQEHQKFNLLLCSMPEILIAIATVFILIFIASASPELLASQYIYSLGYLGLFAMASRHSLETALSLVGINESVKRIFEGTAYE